MLASGLLTNSLTTALLVAAWFVIIQFSEEYFILPEVVGKRVELNIFTTILSIVAWGLLW